MKTLIFQRVLIIGMAALLLVPMGCGKASKEEAQAKEIYERALSLREKGRAVDALHEFARLLDFKETSIFAKAEATPPRGFAYALFRLDGLPELHVYSVHLKSNSGGIDETAPKREEAVFAEALRISAPSW